MSFSSKTHPLQTYVHNVKKKDGTNFEYIEKLDAFFPNILIYPEKEYKNIPEKWNPQDNIWKDLLIEPTDQGSCGSCWAFSCVNTLTDRYNIWSKKKILNGLSPSLIINCNIFATFFKNQQIVKNIDYETWNKESGCFGNVLLASILYIYFFGIPTIECYPYNIDNLTEFKDQRTNFSFYQPSNSNINLKDHSFALKDYTTINLTPSCAFATESQSSPFQYCQDLISVNKYKVYSSIVQNFSITHFYKIQNNEQQIQLEILKNGPVLTAFTIYNDFYTFDAKDSIYIHNTNIDDNPIGGHAVEIVGWGEENEVKYWWIKNTWGKDYGINGYFRIIRGEDMCGIEQNVHGFFPDLFIDYQNYSKIQSYIKDIEKYKYLKPIYSEKLKNLTEDILNYIMNAERKNKMEKISFLSEKYYKKYNSFAYNVMLRSSLLFLFYSNNYLSSHTTNITPLESNFINKNLPIEGYTESVSKKKKIPSYTFLISIIIILIIFFTGIYHSF